jgi:hypothetical protein
MGALWAASGVRGPGISQAGEPGPATGAFPGTLVRSWDLVESWVGVDLQSGEGLELPGLCRTTSGTDSARY